VRLRTTAGVTRFKSEAPITPAAPNVIVNLYFAASATSFRTGVIIENPSAKKFARRSITTDEGFYKEGGKQKKRGPGYRTNEDEATRSDVEHALYEFVNIPAGNAKLRISDPDYCFNFSMPFVIKEKLLRSQKKVKVIMKVFGNGELNLGLRYVG